MYWIDGPTRVLGYSILSYLEADKGWDSPDSELSAAATINDLFPLQQPTRDSFLAGSPTGRYSPRLGFQLANSSFSETAALNKPSSSRRNSHPTLLLFSGLGADSNLFAMQKLRFPELLAPDWLSPLPGEDLDDYLRRWIDMLPTEHVRVVGGASFGGLIAQRVARLIDGPCCVLFGSIKYRSEIPLRLRWLRPLHHFAYLWIIRFWQSVVAGVLWLGQRYFSSSTRSVLRQFTQLDPRLLQWSLRQLYRCLDELPAGPDENPITRRTIEPDRGRDVVFQDRTGPALHQIHGRHDHVFPARKLRQDQRTRIHLLENAGHLLTLFDSGPVNEIIAQLLEQQANSPDGVRNPDPN